MLVRCLERFDAIMKIMLPTLGADRQATYSPFLPVSPKTGHVLQVPTLERNVERGTIVYEEPDGERVEGPVTGGNVKLQWKPDWAMRWAALGVDYEMAGKDLIDSVTQSSKICKALGMPPPEGFNYELFNDEKGEKISKSKGNGLSMEEWLAYAPAESLSYFMFQKPKTAKRLHFDVIPKAVDEYHQQLRALDGQDIAKRIANPVWHIHRGQPPESGMPVSYSMLLNLASAAGAEDEEVLWGFIRQYAPEATPENNPALAEAARGAVRYYNEQVAPFKQRRAPDEKERAALEDLRNRLSNAPAGLDGEALQSIVYEVGMAHEFDPLRAWFTAIYETLLGQSQGPRFGNFVELYGVPETVALIGETLGEGA